MIMIVKGPHDAAMVHCQWMRGANIARKCGALIVLKPEGDDHAIPHQIEKILDGQRFPENPPADLSELHWKPEPVVLVCEDYRKVLDQFDKVCPGFTRFFGPVNQITIK